MSQADFSRMVEAAQSELLLVQMTVKDKGGKRFSRPLAIAGMVILLSYVAVYAPPIRKLAGLDKRLSAARATAQYADRYKDIRSRLDAVYAVLPSESEAGEGLSAAVVESLKTQGVMADALQPPVESELAGMVVQSVSVTMTVSFSELASWILRIESAKPLIHITSIDVRKKEGSLGKNEVTCILTRVLPKVRY